MSMTGPFLDSPFFLVQRSTQAILGEKARELGHAPESPGRADYLREMVLVLLGAPASSRQLWDSLLGRLRAGRVVLLEEVLLARVVVDNWLSLLSVAAGLSEPSGQAVEGASELARATEELRALREEITAAWPGLDQFAPPAALEAVQEALAVLADLEIRRITAEADLALVGQALTERRRGPEGTVIPGLDPGRARQAVSDLEAGKGRPLSEVMERLRRGWPS